MGLRYFVICSTERSGSSLLCHLLRATHKLGRPEEVFGDFKYEQMSERYGASDLDELIAALKRERRTRNGVYGFKAHYHQFDWLMERVDLDAVFPGLRYVYIDRADLMDQAISLARARATGQYSSVHEAKRALEYNHDRIRHCIHALAREKQSWEIFFASMGIEPLRVTYEGLEQDPAEQVRRIGELMDVKKVRDVDLDDVHLEKQRDETSAEWKALYRSQFRRSRLARAG